MADEIKPKTVEHLPTPIKILVSHCQNQDQQGNRRGIIIGLEAVRDSAKALLEYSEQPSAKLLHDWADESIKSYGAMSEKLLGG